MKATRTLPATGSFGFATPTEEKIRRQTVNPPTDGRRSVRRPRYRTRGKAAKVRNNSCQIEDDANQEWLLDSSYRKEIGAVAAQEVTGGKVLRSRQAHGYQRATMRKQSR